MFGMYFRSTKSGSNDFIGGFGLGAKAPSCYNDTFYVQSNYKGTRTLYMFTIGTNDRGSSTVQILEIFNEPTTESGLEVYIEVQPKDVYLFDKKILNLVKYCDQPIVYYILDSTEVEIPYTPTNIVSKGRFTFKFFQTGQLYQAPVSMRMGNVEYDTFSISHHTIANAVIVIDIPIGVMSLPISRESFEDTAANRRVREEIQKALTEVITEDAAPFLGKSLIELVINYKQAYSGKLFVHNLKELYPDYVSFLTRLDRSNVSVSPEMKDGKFLLALIPEVRTSNEWIGRLFDSARKYNKGFFYMSEPQWVKYGEQNPDIADLFLAKKVRSRVFLPDLGKGDGTVKNVDIFTQQYNVLIPGKYYGSAKASKNALQIHNNARLEFGLDTAEDANEARDQIAEMKESGFFDDIKKLNWFTYEKSTAKHDWWAISSSKQIEALKSLGWFERYSSECTDIRDFIHNKIKEAAKIDQTIKSALPSFIGSNYSIRITPLLKKKINRAEKMAQMWDTIRNEDSFRGRMIKTLERNSYYYDNLKLSRQDVRKILKTK
jgi:hypothetical protein